MHNPPLILVVDDTEANVDILKMRLESQGYEVATASDGEEGLAKAQELEPDLILLDIMMPKLDGIEVTKRLKAAPGSRFTPIILVTAKADSKDVVAGLNAGGDDYLTKPVDHSALMARVRSMLRIKSLHDQVSEQALRLDAQARELEGWNKTLEERVSVQVDEIERIGRLKRFLAPQLAELVVSKGEEKLLESHRRDIVVVFCDLRGFTAFAETSEPEDIMALLAEYHDALGPIIFQHEGTLERYAGDGLMIFFNDPVPCPDPAARAVKMAIDMREAVAGLARGWKQRGHLLGFGVGIAQGYATLGRIGFHGRFDYSAIGTVTNVAARLCSEAKDGQILVSQRVATAIEAMAKMQPLGEVALKGLSRPVPVFDVVEIEARAAPTASAAS